MAETVKETTKLVGPMYGELMHTHLKWKPHELNHYIPHQAGLRSVKKHAGVPVSVDLLGNIVSATIPVSLQLLRRDNRLRDREKIYLSGTGSGYV